MSRRKYTFGTFLWDIFLLCITLGLWIVGIYCREMRRPSGRRYGALSFIGDMIMTTITFGFWLIWIFCRELRNR